MSMAIKYRMMKKKCMADGGPVDDMDMVEDTAKSPGTDKKTADTFRKAFNYADGGLVHEEEASGYPKHLLADEDQEMIDHIMKKRHMAKGGEIANDTGEGEEADFEPNQFDDLVKEDHLEAHYPESEEIGDHEEDEDRRDVVAMIMKSRKKKDRMPHPA